MKNKIVLSILIIIGISINIILVYPEVNNYIRVRNDYKYYKSITSIEKKKENEEDNIKSNLSELELLNSKTNQAKKDIEKLLKDIEDKNTKIKELDSKIKQVENNIKNQNNEKDRIKKMFE